MKQDLIKILRRQIEQSGKSRYRIARDTGVDESQLHRIMRGESGCNTKTLGVLFDYLGIKVVVAKAHSKGRKSR